MNVKCLIVAAALAAVPLGAAAQDASKDAKAGPVKIGAIEVSGPWARATPRGASVGAGYLKLTNTGTVSDRLVGGSFEASGKVEAHEMSMTNGVMRMRPLANGLEIKPGESVELKPNSYHLMLVGLKRPLQQGQTIKGTLTFEKAGSGEVEFSILPVGSPGPAAGGQDNKNMHMHMH